MDSLELLHSSLESHILILESTLEDTGVLSQGLDKLTLPVEKLGQPNFDAPAEYRDSPFRKIQFKFQAKPGISHPFLEAQKGRAITYSALCEFVRTYIEINKLGVGGGLIKCDPFLKEVVGPVDTVTFFSLLQKFNRIIQ